MGHVVAATGGPRSPPGIPHTTSTQGTPPQPVLTWKACRWISAHRLRGKGRGRGKGVNKWWMGPQSGPPAVDVWVALLHRCQPLFEASMSSPRRKAGKEWELSPAAGGKGAEAEALQRMRMHARCVSAPCQVR